MSPLCKFFDIPISIKCFFPGENITRSPGSTSKDSIFFIEIKPELLSVSEL